MKKILDLADLSDEAIASILAGVPRGAEPLRGKVLGLLFLDPSLRTLASMQAAMAQLGGSSFVVTPGQGTWKLEMKDGAVMDGDAAEHVREAIAVLSQYADVLGVRCFARAESLEEDLLDVAMTRMAALSSVPFVNLESAVSHPCQALADWKTLDDVGVPRHGRIVLSWAYHPRPLPYAVPASVLTMAARRGMQVCVLRPEGFALPAPLMERARAIAAASGGRVLETGDRREAMEGAHVLYAKSWCAPSLYGRPSEEAALRAPHRDWCVRESWFSGAPPAPRSCTACRCGAT
ncbi:MAG: acetylornithine carbamoyltransferase [Acidobacteriota bacterium]